MKLQEERNWMIDVVWASYGMMNEANMLFLRSDRGDNPEDSTLDDGRRNAAGEPLGPENFPKVLWGYDEFKEDQSLPDFFHGSSAWVVSGRAATVLREFDLGSGALYPVTILKKDRKTPMPGEWFCLNFGNVKHAFLKEGSPKARRAGPSGTRWRLPYILKDDDLAVSNDALPGPDIWVDPAIAPTFFASDSLAKALKAAHADKSFGLKRCRVIPT